MTIRAMMTVAALSAMFHASGPAQAPEEQPAEARVDGIFEEYNSASSPGCAVAGYQEDRIVLRKAYGMANLDHDVPLSPATIFHVASVSKQFTAAAILLLAQEGKLSIDDDVRKFVPELPDFGERITIRHLANHTSGLRDQWSLLGLAGWRYSRDLITDDDVLELVTRQKALNFKPGERHLYSNTGYTLMAIIVSRVSGKSFREFTTERIFQPLGMASTHFRDNFGEIVRNQAYGYAREGDRYRLSVTNFDTAGATSLLTTVEDLARWHANFDTPVVGGERLVSGLLDRGVLGNGERIDYAFGITHGAYRGLPTVLHGGADAGYRSAFVRFPDQRFGVSTLCNIASANPIELALRVADVFLAEKLGPRTETADDEPEIRLPPEQLRSYAGLYWNDAAAAARRFAVEDGRLHAVLGRERVPLKSLGDGRFVLVSGPRTRLAFETEAGRGARVTVTGGTSDVFVRTEPVTPGESQLREFAGVYRSDEMDVVYRMTVRDGVLRLERSRSRPAPLDPLIPDTFGSPAGTIRFTRSVARAVTGFVLDSGRVRHVTFWKDTSAVSQPTASR